jgi:hypothetical protein
MERNKVTQLRRNRSYNTKRAKKLAMKTKIKKQKIVEAKPVKRQVMMKINAY